MQGRGASGAPEMRPSRALTNFSFVCFLRELCLVAAKGDGREPFFETLPPIQLSRSTSFVCTKFLPYFFIWLTGYVIA